MGNPEWLGLTVGAEMLPRAEISARLKAARWIAAAADDKGKPVPLSVADLVEREPLKSNRFAKNRLENIEQARVDARSMELEKIAEALGLPHEWFTTSDLHELISATAPGVSDVGAEARAAEADLDRRGAGEGRPGRSEGRAAGS